MYTHRIGFVAFLMAALATTVNAQVEAPPPAKKVPPVIRDHRDPPPVVRDHRKPKPPPVVRDHRTPVDLRTASYHLAGDSMVINVVNHGGNGKNAPSKLRVPMYRTIDGKERLIATAYADVPMIPSGTHRGIALRFTHTIANCRLEGQVDYQQQVPESDDRNNGFRATIK